MGKNLVITCLLFIISTWAYPCRAQDYAQQMPDFKRCFEVLRKNRIIYNRQNDSIFLIKDHNKWVNYFWQRSIINHHLYDADKVAVTTIKDYFNQPLDSIPREAYLDFFNAFNQEYVTRAMSDPFMVFSFSGILQKGLRLMPDSLNYSNMIHLWQLASYLQMWNLGGNEQYIKEAYKHGLQLMSDSAKSLPYYEYAYPRALLLMPRTIWYLHHLQTIDEYKANCRRLDEYLERRDIEKHVSAEILEDLRRMQWQEEEALVRNVYLSDTISMIKNHDKGIIERVIQRNLTADSLSDVSFVRTLYMQIQTGQITADEAWKKWQKRYKVIRKELRNKHLNAKEIVMFLQPFYTAAFINHKTTLSESQKHKNALMMCKDMERAYLIRKDQQHSTDYIRSLSSLSTDKWMIRHLTPKERIRFVNSLTVVTHISTYAHSVHVAKISEVLMQAILKHSPGLLRGCLGYQLEEDIVNNKQAFLSFIYEASLYHDIGKSPILSVVNNEYRPLSEEERKVIQRHPTLALHYLNLAPELNKFHDTTLGHHKWYNGERGYPDDFDNTKSDVRIMIDIVHLSDCIQAATEKVGRNYRYEKPYDVVMQELREGAGTMYNPKLVALIDAHPDLAKDLKYLVEDGWAEIYYNIYKQYFKHPLISPTK